MTLVIFNLHPEIIKYYITSCDVSKFQGVYINSTDTGLEKELCNMVYGEYGEELLDFVTDASTLDLSKVTKAVECGFIL